MLILYKPSLLDFARAERERERANDPELQGCKHIVLAAECSR